MFYLVINRFTGVYDDYSSWVILMKRLRLKSSVQGEEQQQVNAVLDAEDV